MAEPSVDDSRSRKARTSTLARLDRLKLDLGAQIIITGRCTDTDDAWANDPRVRMGLR